MKRRLKLFVATSLDGYIARPDGSVDWLFHDQDYGFTPFYDSIDTVVLGRKTYDFGVEHGMSSFKGKRNVVFSRTLTSSPDPAIEFVSSNPAAFTRALLEEDGQDVWLCGGTQITMLLRDMITDVMLAVHPIVLGQGIPLFRPHPDPLPLKLTHLKQYETGLVTMYYEVKSS